MLKWLKRGLLSSLFAVAVSGTGWAIDPVDTSQLVNAVTAEKIRVHLRKLQEIADRRGGNRVSGSLGHRDSVKYVTNRLINAGYSVQVQQFPFVIFRENAPPGLVRTAPGNRVYETERDFTTMEFSGSGDVTGQLALARRIVLPPGDEPSTSDSGCRPEDFDNVAGKIVLIQRGTCTFEEKANFAAAAGAVGVVIFNEGRPGRTEVLGGTLGNPVPIPVVGTTFALGNDLYERVRSRVRVELILTIDSANERITSTNVIAKRAGEVDNRVLIAGGHLDSVEEGPGIQDNGTGTAALLTIAEEFAKMNVRPRNSIRFAFWGGEEQGLKGSTHYVTKLSERELSRIALNLNFDMIGSPNYVRFVYDGNGTIGPAGPPGSDVIEDVFVEYFDSLGLASEPTEFDGRSDYQAFINAGIPAGGSSPARRKSRPPSRRGSMAAGRESPTIRATTRPATTSTTRATAR